MLPNNLLLILFMYKIVSSQFSYPNDWFYIVSDYIALVGRCRLAIDIDEKTYPNIIPGNTSLLVYPWNADVYSQRWRVVAGDRIQHRTTGLVITAKQDSYLVLDHFNPNNAYQRFSYIQHATFGKRFLFVGKLAVTIDYTYGTDKVDPYFLLGRRVSLEEFPVGPNQYAINQVWNLVRASPVIQETPPGLRPLNIIKLLKRDKKNITQKWSLN